jgi:hypothetical protein
MLDEAATAKHNGVDGVVPNAAAQLAKQRGSSHRRGSGLPSGDMAQPRDVRSNKPRRSDGGASVGSGAENDAKRVRTPAERRKSMVLQQHENKFKAFGGVGNIEVDLFTNNKFARFMREVALSTLVRHGTVSTAL